jgi:hypothetical protein
MPQRCRPQAPASGKAEVAIIEALDSVGPARRRVRGPGWPPSTRASGKLNTRRGGPLDARHIGP